MKYTPEDIKRLVKRGHIQVWDAGELYCDRYTVWLVQRFMPVSEWGVYGFGMSGAPFHPQGFNQCLHHPYAPPYARDKRLRLRDIPADILSATAQRLSD